MSVQFTQRSKFKCLLTFIGCLLLFSSCRNHQKLTLLVPDEDVSQMEKIVGEINSHSDFNISIVTKDSLTEVIAIDAILNNEFDITPVDNTLDYQQSKKHIRTIIPLFHEVLVVLSRHKLTQKAIDSLLRAENYLILTKEVEELDIYNKMIPRYSKGTSINYRIEDHFNLEKDLQDQELLLFFSDKDNLELGQLLFEKKAYIYSLDTSDLKGKGSFIEGFCDDYKKTTPFILSRSAFGIVLDEPIYTISVHELLVTSKEMPNDIIYDLIETIHGHHIIPIFESSNNYSFEVNHQDINLSFPFHSGTINYMDREKPKFIERYAEVMGFVLSAFVLLVGLGATLKASFNRKKKDRMDEYYKDLLNIKTNLMTFNPDDIRKQLNDLQKKVFVLLIDEKLSANNEFLIFMMLWQELSQHLDDLLDLVL